MNLYRGVRVMRLRCDKNVEAPDFVRDMSTEAVAPLYDLYRKVK